MEYCYKCGWVKQQCQCEKPMTNANRIRNMTDEELANSVYIPCPYNDGVYGECKFGWHEQKQTCEECKLEWLRMTTKDK